MPAKFAIVYASGSKAIRRIIVADDELSLDDDTHPIGPGETKLVVNSSDHTLEACKAHVKQATGVHPPDLRCAVVRNNVVEHIIHADPDIDSLPDAELVLIPHSSNHEG